MWCSVTLNGIVVKKIYICEKVGSDWKCRMVWYAKGWKYQWNICGLCGIKYERMDINITSMWCYTNKNSVWWMRGGGNSLRSHTQKNNTHDTPRSWTTPHTTHHKHINNTPHRNKKKKIKNLFYPLYIGSSPRLHTDNYWPPRTPGLEWTKVFGLLGLRRFWPSNHFGGSFSGISVGRYVFKHRVF